MKLFTVAFDFSEKPALAAASGGEEFRPNVAFFGTIFSLKIRTLLGK